MATDRGIGHAPDGVSADQRPEGPRTKIEAVRSQLLLNRDVHFAGEVHYPDHATRTHGWTETVAMIVSPVKPQFNVNKLNAFMDGLITGVELSARDEAHSGSDRRSRETLDLGKLYFDEAIGTIRTTTVTTIETEEPETIQKAGGIVGESTKNAQGTLQRRTWVRVYPDQTSALDAFQHAHDDTGVETGRPDSDYYHTEFHLGPDYLKELKRQYDGNHGIGRLCRRGQ